MILFFLFSFRPEIKEIQSNNEWAHYRAIVSKQIQYPRSFSLVSFI